MGGGGGGGGSLLLFFAVVFKLPFLILLCLFCLFFFPFFKKQTNLVLIQWAQLCTLHTDDDHVGLNVLRCWVDILGTDCNMLHT